ncbi:MAG: transposase [Candidatus Niyogibacteria bacterium]|nr:transposase [Candidatus Niyogibacteria bacterium]
MATRRTSFEENEHYHIYNRGVDKRNIFLDRNDVDRFFLSMNLFNAAEPIGSIYESRFGSLASKLEKTPLVNFVSYCLNPNHFHFLLEQNTEKGIEKFMQRLGTGYTKYFNTRYKRTGALFQGVFKSIGIDSNDYLLRAASYINLNDRVHQLGSDASKLVRSSWYEYQNENAVKFCKKDIVLEQFDNRKEHERFALESIENSIERKKQEKELTDLLLE